MAAGRRQRGCQLAAGCCFTLFSAGTQRTCLCGFPSCPSPLGNAAAFDKAGGSGALRAGLAHPPFISCSTGALGRAPLQLWGFGDRGGAGASTAGSQGTDQHPVEEAWEVGNAPWRAELAPNNQPSRAGDIPGCWNPIAHG